MGNGPMGKERGLPPCEAFDPLPCLSQAALQTFVFPLRPAHQCEVELLKDRRQQRFVETAAILEA